ncbi:MAG: MerR family transcriptional regulator [Alphaproteobacteria bacterium]
MDYTVVDLGQATGTSVDTIRYYQTLGLLPAPRRVGRNAVYGDAHVERLERIQEFSRRGFSLKAIQAVLDAGSTSRSDHALLGAIADGSAEPHFSGAEMAEQLDLPRAVVAMIEKSGLVDDTLSDDPAKRFSKSEVDVARGAVRLLRYGFPVTRLLGLALKHDRAVRKVVDEAIDLFDEHVRKTAGDDEDPEAVAEAFRELLPVVTALVGHHFQRVLVNRAIKRLKKSGDEGALETAVRESKRTRIGFRWR